MSAAWYRARADLRRWRPLLALIVLIGLVGGATLFTLAGARRSSTAYDRFRTEARASDLDISTSDPDPAKWAQVAGLPQIEALGRSAFPFIRPLGTDLYPYLDISVAVGPDGKLGTVVDRPRLVSGRMPDPARSDEMAVSAAFVAGQDVRIGEQVTFESYEPEQFAALFGEGGAVDPSGPRVTLTITGVFRHPNELSRQSNFETQVFLAPAFYEEYDGRIGMYEVGGSARLRRGERDVVAVTESIRQIYRDDPELELASASEAEDPIRESIRVVVAALLLCGACAAAAGTAAVGQTLSRHFSVAAPDQVVLAAMGMGRLERTASLALAVLPAAVVGALLASVVSVAASPLMPVGDPRKADPDLGFSIDWAVLIAGFVSIVLVVATAAVASGWIVGRTTNERRVGSSPPRSTYRLLGRAGLPPSATTGTSFALERGEGRSTVPVRSSMIGAAVAVAGLVAVAVFAASLADLAGRSDRYGFPWDAVVAGFDGGVVDEFGGVLSADPRVEALGVIASSLGQADGADVNTYSFESLKGSAGPTLIDGRMPQGPDEVVLGRSTERDAGASLGDTVQLTGVDGLVRLEVVGIAAFPALDERSRVNHGVALTREGFDRLAQRDPVNIDLSVTWADGVNAASATRDLERLTGSPVVPPRVPADLRNLVAVDTVPAALAALLAFLAVVAVVHVLTVSSRRHARDFAVLRTLGFVRRQLRTTLTWQTSLWTIVGLAAGIPLGIAAGRAAWAVESTSLGVIDHPVVPLRTIGVVVAAGLVLAGLVAAVSVRRIADRRPADALREG